jgi:hypothetical protein
VYQTTLRALRIHAHSANARGIARWTGFSPAGVPIERHTHINLLPGQETAAPVSVEINPPPVAGIVNDELSILYLAKARWYFLEIRFQYSLKCLFELGLILNQEA